MLATEPGFLRVEFLNLMTIQHIENRECSFSILVPGEWKGNHLLVFNFVSLVIGSCSKVNGRFCSKRSRIWITFYIHDRLGMKFRIGLITGCKLHVDDGQLFFSGIQCQGIGEGINTELCFSNGADQSADVLIILTLCCSQSWILADAFHRLLPIDSRIDRGDRGLFGFICMAAGKAKYITQVQRRIADGF